MSRIGKLPLPLPSGVTLSVTSGEAVVKGPKGEVKLALPSGVAVNVEDGSAGVERKSNSKHDRACHGMVRSILAAGIKGV